MNQHNIMMVGELIRTHRRAAGLSQAELATALGVSPSAVGQWETKTDGKRNTPSVENLFAIACTLNLSMADFFAGAGARLTAADERENQVLREFRSLPETQRKAFLTMLRAATSKGGRG